MTAIPGGFWQAPAGEAAGVLVLTHGAGSNAASPLLAAVAEGFVEAGYAVLRYDLPFRQARPHGPPFPAMAARDRAGLREALQSAAGRGPVLAGGHSYGGRQASMLLAEQPELAAALLLLSYPLHPPARAGAPSLRRKPAVPRTAHFPQLRTPALFVHGSRDPFGSVGEMTAALALIPARTELRVIEGRGHDLKPYTWVDGIVEALARLRG